VTSVSFTEALRFWAKLGWVSFGGPAGQIAIMHAELVQRRRWISERRFLHALNFCMLLPGPEAQQLATYIGWLLHRTRGAIAAGLLFILPGLLILIGLSYVYLRFGDLWWVAGIFYGIKPAVAAIILHAAWRIGGRVLHNPALWGIAIAAFAAIFLARLPFPWIVLGAALLGVLGGYRWPHWFGGSPHTAATALTERPALIDDDTPQAEHTRFRWLRLLRLGVIGALLWALPMALLWLGLGWSHTLTQMGWFFTTAALLTFGGAYAVLPYVYQGAVEHYGWVSGPQMMDGLALGETTPGPLIMVVAFVAFVGAYVDASFGADLRFLAGALAAVLVTWFTFLPSFLFILGGGPLVESSRGSQRLAAPLTAITAAVVGVIVNLALFFAYFVVWPAGLAASPDLLAVAILAATILALFRFRRSVIEIIVASSVVGLALAVASLR